MSETTRNKGASTQQAQDSGTEEAASKAPQSEGTDASPEQNESAATKSKSAATKSTAKASQGKSTAKASQGKSAGSAAAGKAGAGASSGRSGSAKAAAASGSGRTKAAASGSGSKASSGKSAAKSGSSGGSSSGRSTSRRGSSKQPAAGRSSSEQAAPSRTEPESSTAVDVPLGVLVGAAEKVGGLVGPFTDRGAAEKRVREYRRQFEDSVRKASARGAGARSQAQDRIRRLPEDDRLKDLTDRAENLQRELTRALDTQSTRAQELIGQVGEQIGARR